MSIEYLKKDIKLLLSDIQICINKQGSNDLNYKELIKVQHHLKEVKIIIKGV